MKAQPLGPVLHSYFADHLIELVAIDPADAGRLIYRGQEALVLKA